MALVDAFVLLVISVYTFSKTRYNLTLEPVTTLEQTGTTQKRETTTLPSVR